MRQFDERIAKDIGVNCAIVIQQLHYWTIKGMGKSKGELKFIYNSYEQWQENFPFWSVSTIKRIFYKLTELGIVVKDKQLAWDKTSHYALNYSHPIVSKWYDGSGQNGTMDRVKLARRYNTYINQRKQQQPTAVGISSSSLQTTENSADTSKKTYKEYYPKAEKWLLSMPPDFQREVGRYIDYHVNSPKVSYPQAFKMAIVVEIWKKHNGKMNHTDFEYIDKQAIKEIITPCMETEPRKDFKAGFEEEMHKLYFEGEL